MNSTPCIILDNGGDTIKAGIGGEFRPRVVIPSVIGYEKSINKVTNETTSSLPSTSFKPINPSLSLDDSKAVCFGQAALDRSSELILNRPIQKGALINWDDMTQLWEHIFTSQLSLNTSEHTILSTVLPTTPKPLRERQLTLFFEHFNAPKVYITNGIALALYGGSYNPSGIAVDTGYDHTMIVSINNFSMFRDSIRTIDLGGKHLTEYLGKLLERKGYKDIPFAILNDIKEKHCYCAEDPFREYDKVKEVAYKLPDGKEVKLKDELYEVGEVFEHPELVGKAMGGFARELCNSIYYADKEKKKEICTDIVVTGGNSLVKGFLKRFTEEAKDCLSGRYEKRINIVDVPDRLYAQWIGASICSYRPLFNTFCTTRQEYDEYGPSVMHCKPIMF